MERSKCCMMFILIFILGTNLLANPKEQIYRAYVLNDMKAWKTTIDRMDSSADQSTGNLLDLVNYQYGYIAWCIGNDRYKEAKTYLSSAFKNLSLLAGITADSSTINAYRAAFYGYEIGLAKYKAPYYGLKSIEASKKALEQDHNNWLAIVQRANIQYYMPALFGGSKTEALSDYEKALMVMEQQQELTTGNWNYLNLMTVIAEGYLALDDFNNAEKYYKKILNNEPEFSWVKNELYPQLLELKKKQYE